MSTIKSSTTLTTAYSVEADTTGALVIQTGAGPTTAVTVDASQNVGIGTASPSGRLNLAVGASTSCTMRFTANNTGTGAGDRGRLDFYSADNSGTAYQLGYMDYDRSDGTGTASYIAWANRVSGTVAERMRIDSSGNLLVGTTSATSKITFKQGGDNASGGMAFVRGDSSNYFYLLTGADNNFYFGYNGSARAVINGSTGAYTALSDARLKENVTPIAHGLNAILSLNPVSYTMVGDETAVQQIGLIAQEVEPVVPEVISAPTVSNSWYGLNYAGFVPVLIKAIQEQQALITQLQADVAALKGATP